MISVMRYLAWSHAYEQKANDICRGWVKWKQNRELQYKKDSSDLLDEKALEITCTTRIYILLNCTLINSQDGNYIMCILKNL